MRWKWMNARTIGRCMALAALAAICIPWAKATDDKHVPFTSSRIRPNRSLSAQHPLEGKQLVIRAYHKKDAGTASYSGEQVEIRQGRVSIPKAQHTLWVVMAAGQTDPAVAKIIGQAIYLLPPAGEWSVEEHLTTGQPGHVLVDALGQALPAKDLQATILLGEPTAGERVDPSQPPELDKTTWRLTLDEIPTDAQGRPVLPEVRSNASFALRGYLFFHPDYGTALSNLSLFGRTWDIQLPLVRQGTPARERALSGQVVTPDGAPIPEAVVECSSVRTPGNGLIQGFDNRVACDPQGRFTIYVPDMNPRNEHGELIPPNSRYQLTVTASRQFGLLPYVGEHPNTAPARIVMKKGDAFHTFVFETPQGRLNAPEQLAQITVIYRPVAGGPAILPIQPEIIRDGGYVASGIYEAQYRGFLKFTPVTIDAKSPQAIVFSVPPSLEYRGRVIDGVTSRPLAGAFVIGMNGSMNTSRLSDLTPDQWQELHRLSTPIPMTDKALEPLRRLYMFSCATRTAADGSWSLPLQPGEQIHAILAFDQNTLCFNVPAHMKKPDARNQVTVAPIRLYPAARVTFTPTFKNALGGHVSMMPRWVIGKTGNPPWAAELIPWVNWNRQNEGQFEYDAWLKENVANTIDVPAGVHLKVRLETPYNEDLGDLEIPMDVLLKPGECKELGVQEIPHDALVAVQVTDDAGTPVEGIPLRLKMERDGDVPIWKVPHNTDAHGVALFYVTPGRKVSIGFMDYDIQKHTFKEYPVAVEATGKEVEPPVFTLKLSREVIKKALASKQ